MTRFPAGRTDVPRILGHRGAVGHAPENTIAGIRKAKELGCEWVEVDCMLTMDPVVILHHDQDLGRTNNGTGVVSDKTFAELRRLDAGSWFSPSYAGTAIPTFDETIAALGALNMGANVEIKPVEGYEKATGKQVARETADKWPAHLPPPVMSSFYLDALEAAMEEAPELDRAILWWNIPGDWAEHQERLQASAVHVSVKKLTEDWAKAFNDAGVPFRVYTVNDPADAERVFGWGAQSIFTDYPDRFL